MGFTPSVLLVTTTVTVQPAAGRLGTVRLSAVAPTVSAGLFVTPAHVPPMVVEDTLIFVNVSVKFAFVSAPAFGLPNVNVIVEVPPDWIVAGLNAFAIVGALITVRFAVLETAPAVGV